MRDDVTPPVAQASEVLARSKRWVGQHRYLLLLIALFALIVLEPSAGPLRGDWTSDLLFCLVLLAAVLAIRGHPRPFALGAVLAGAAIPVVWAAYLAAVQSLEVQEALLAARHVLNLALLLVAGCVILKDLLTAEVITADAIFGAICIYLLIGVVWWLGYSLLEHLQPGSFQAGGASVAASGLEESRDCLLYYSFVTLTTLGYGDVTAPAEPARTMSWVEAAVGQLYLAILLARFVGMHIAHLSRRS